MPSIIKRCPRCGGEIPITFITWVRAYTVETVSKQPAIVCPICFRRVVYDFWFGIGHVGIMVIWGLAVRSLSLPEEFVVGLLVLGLIIIEYVFVMMTPLRDPEAE